VFRASRSTPQQTPNSRSRGQPVPSAALVVGEPFTRPERRVVFGLGGDEAAVVARLGIAARPINAFDGEVVALVPPAVRSPRTDGTEIVAIRSREFLHATPGAGGGVQRGGIPTVAQTAVIASKKRGDRGGGSVLQVDQTCPG